MLLNRKYIYRGLFIAIILLIIGYVLKNKYESFKLENEGELAIATFVRIDPYFKGGPDINFVYSFNGIKTEAYDKLKNEKDRNLKIGDQFLIKYLPNNKLTLLSD